jgi:hypothetical protein
MVNLSRPPLPLDMLYFLPFNYPEYVKDSDPNVHVKVLKVDIRANGETKSVKFVDLFSFTLRNTMSNWCNNYTGDYLNCTFA